MQRCCLLVSKTGLVGNRCQERTAWDARRVAKKTAVEGCSRRKRVDGTSLPISKGETRTVDERNQGMSGRVRTCYLTPCLCTASVISIRAGKTRARSSSRCRRHFRRRNRRDCQEVALNESRERDCRYRFPSSEQCCTVRGLSLHGKLYSVHAYG